jgi:hypothetical protein
VLLPEKKKKKEFFIVFSKKKEAPGEVLRSLVTFRDFL